MSEIHVVPQNDEREHELTKECWCNPDLEWANPDTGEVYEWPIVAHHSLDCREEVEALLQESIAEDKKWEMIQMDDCG